MLIVASNRPSSALDKLNTDLLLIDGKTRKKRHWRFEVQKLKVLLDADREWLKTTSAGFRPISHRLSGSSEGNLAI
jgi:hypothetical protein